MHAASASASSTHLFQQFNAHFYSRRLLLKSLLNQFQATATPPSSGNSNSTISDPYHNVVMGVSMLLCALICSLVLNYIIRCALKCSGLISGQTSDRPTGRLANTGIKKKVLRTFPVVSYSADQVKQPGCDTVCVICLSEFSPGERVPVLPKCNHGFHVPCIDRWLNIHSSCPTCRHCLVETCQKIVGSSQASTSEPPPPPPPPLPLPSPPESVIRIGPLEPEGLLRKCQT